MSNKKTIRLLMSLIILLALVMAVSFALWQVTEKQTNKNSLGSACINISYSNDSANISLADAWPMTDEEGLASTPYTFTITNDCDIAVNYQVSLESLLKDNYTEDSYIDGDYIKVSLDGDYILDTYNVFPSITNDNNQIKDTKKIATGKLYAYGSKTYDLRLWLDEETPYTQMGKKFHSRIKVVGGQGIGLDCYIVDSEGTLTHYNPDCGISASIPATVNGRPVKKIASDAFKTGDRYVYFLNSGTTYDDLEFSILANPIIVKAINDNDYATIAGATADDFKFIIYNEDDKKINNVMKYIKEHHDSDPYIYQLYQLEDISSLRVDDIKIVKYSHLTGNPVGSEFFYKVEESNGNYVPSYVGFRESEGFESSLRFFTINFLDLSDATNLEEIDDNAFFGLYMKGLQLRFPNSLRRIGKSAFYNSRFTPVFNNGLQSIDDYAFVENYTMNNIDVPSSVTSLGLLSLSGNPNITITVHSQELYDTRPSVTDHTWAGAGATIIYEP